MILVCIALGCSDGGKPAEATDAALAPQTPLLDGPMPSVGGIPDGGPGAKLDLRACIELRDRAVATVTAAAMSVQQCQVDTDCVRLNLDSPCWQGCATAALAGNQGTRSAVASKAAEVAQLCEAFDRGGCEIAGGTDQCFGSEAVGTSFKCEVGKCVYADPTTCNALSQEASGTVKTAALSVDQCLVDADCQRIPVATPCWDSCGSAYAGNQATRDAIAAQSGTVAAICDRFTRAGCIVLASGCPGWPATYQFHCDNRKCVFR